MNDQLRPTLREEVETAARQYDRGIITLGELIGHLIRLDIEDQPEGLVLARYGIVIEG
jgi:hypothetical protein